MPSKRRALEEHDHAAGALLRYLVIALTAFLTVVDLFATQAILPSLAQHYGVSPAAMGFAVNASTIGMAVSGLAVGYFSREIDRRTASCQPRLARDPDRAAGECTGSRHLHPSAGGARPVHGRGLHADAGLSRRTLQRRGFRQRICRLYHRQRRKQSDRSPDLGRRRRPFRPRHNFYFFAVLNLLGAVLVYFSVEKTPSMGAGAGTSSPFTAWLMHLRNPPLRASFAIGFCILFAFIGTFTYVNFVLVQPPLGVGPMTLGFVYFVFLPTITTTPLAGRAVKRFGTRPPSGPRCVPSPAFPF